MRWKLLSINPFKEAIVFHDTIYIDDDAINQVYISKGVIVENKISNFGGSSGIYTDGNTMYAADGDRGFYYSKDGRSWINNNAGIPEDSYWYPEGHGGGVWIYQHSLYSITGNSQYLFGGTQHGIYRYSFSSKSWESINKSISANNQSSILCKDSVVITTSIDYPGDSVLIYKSIDNGNSWDVKYVIPSCVVNEIKNINDTLYLSTSGAYPFNIGQGLFVTYDIGETWTQLITRSLRNFYGVENSNSKYYLASDSGIYFNMNTLTNIDNNIVYSYIRALAGNDSSIAAVYYNDNGNSIGITKNKGISWTNSTKNILPISFIDNVINVNNSFLFSESYSSLDTVPPCKNYISDDNGSSWNLISTLHNNEDPYTLVSNQSRIIAYNDDYMMISFDNGQTWKNVNPPLICNEFLSALCFGDNIYFTECDNDALIMSSDYVHWRVINNGLPQAQVTIPGYFHGILFLDTGSSLYTSVDSGMNWQLRSNQIGDINSFTSDSVNIYVSSGGGVYFSSDSGKTWNNITSGLPPTNYTAYSIGPLLVKDGYLYYGTTNFGVWRRSLQNLPLIVKNINSTEVFDVFPNPSNGIFDLKLDDIQTGKLKVFNTLGKIIYQTNLSNNRISIDLSGCLPGIYILQVQSDNRMYNKRIIKE